MSSVKFRLAQLYDSCDCEKKKRHELHYLTFDETFHRLREVTDDVLKYLNDKGEILKFVFGQTYVKPREDCYFSFNDRKTWSKKEVKDKKVFWEDKDFNEMIVIGCVEEDLIRNDAYDVMRDSETYAIALLQRLIMHYAYQKPDERLFINSLHPERTTLEKSDGNVLYIALKLDSNKEKRKRHKRKGKYPSSTSSSSSSSSEKSSSSDSSSSSDERDDSSDSEKEKGKEKEKKKKKKTKKKNKEKNEKAKHEDESEGEDLEEKSKKSKEKSKGKHKTKKH